MKAHKRSLLAFSIAGAVAFATPPVWAQVGSQGERSGGSSSPSEGQSGAGEGEKKGAPLRDERTQTGGMGESGSSASPSQAGRTKERRAGMGAANEDVKKVQQALKDKGQDPGEIDGVMGPKTKEALKAFQEKQGLQSTGSLDDRTKKALGIEGGAASRGSSAKSGMATGTGPSTDGRDSVRGGEGGKQQ